MASFHNNSIFWIEIDRIKPNPYQPRRAFDEAKLSDLAESIKQYGILQPLVAARHEEVNEEGGLSVTYELIVGERRLRASRLAGLTQVPVIIRSGVEENQMKLELSIVENIQREDLNAIDRSLAFQRLVNEFNFKHSQVAEKVGKSREYVSNTLRLLSLPQEIQQALSKGDITEGHARPLMMLSDKPEERQTLFREILLKKLTVREAEGIARRSAQDKLRKKSHLLNPKILEFEKQFTEMLGTRVHIEPRENGGKILIDFFSDDDLHALLNRLAAEQIKEKKGFFDRFMERGEKEGEAKAISDNPPLGDGTPAKGDASSTNEASGGEKKDDPSRLGQSEADPSHKNESEADEDLYSVKNFSI